MDTSHEMNVFTVKIRTYGIAREIIGASVLEISIPENASAESVLKQVQHQFPKLQHLRSLALAINESYADSGQIIRSTDDLALIPPVSGG